MISSGGRNMETNETIILEAIRYYVEQNIGDIETLEDYAPDNLITIDTGIRLDRFPVEPTKEEIPEMVNRLAPRIASLLNAVSCELYIHLNTVEEYLDINADIILMD
jgi:hypothetical protein